MKKYEVPSEVMYEVHNSSDRNIEEMKTILIEKQLR